ncbi:MAG TPA: alpha/beta hydrolase-fold protein [Candidatus Acidoferrum sp.]|nr:alpha/beta hydrolase-fold protein [Candidatus Acidoferrum sp.]
MLAKIGMAIVAIVIPFVVIVTLGAPAGVAATFILMGFDADRAALIGALVIGGICAATIAAIGGWRLRAALVGSVASAVIFGGPFADETRSAAASQGVSGAFDPIGWLTTLTALVVGTFAIDWAISCIAVSVRQLVIAAASDARAAISDRRLRDWAWVRAGALLVSLVIVGGSFSLLGDMLNYSPDLLMRSGGHAVLGLLDPGTRVGDGLGASPSIPPDMVATGGGQVPPDLPSPTPSAGLGPVAIRLVPGPLDRSLVTNGSWIPARPWLAWRPVGHGTIDSLFLPAPYVGGAGASASVAVYVPAGYDRGIRTYPVTYEVPWHLKSMLRSMQVVDQLDALISSGAIPAQIVVFADLVAGPYPASQCADSSDGRQWWDRYVATTLVPTIDRTFRTIPLAADRSVIGFSEGGYCAADLLARHPDLFGQAVSISGYYHAAPRSNQTANAAAVFGGDAALLAAYSPDAIVRSMAPVVRQRVFFVLDGTPKEPFYGSQMTSFSTELAALGVPSAFIPDTIGHSWTETRTMFGPLMALLAGHLAATGALAP